MQNELRNDDLLNQNTAWEYAALEAALRNLQPRNSRVDREQLLYQAGRSSARRELGRRRVGGWIWPVTSVLSLAGCVLLGVLYLGTQREQRSFRPEMAVKQPVPHQPRRKEQPRNRDVDTPRAPVAAQHPHPPHQPHQTTRPVLPDRWMASVLWRSRHPVLATSVDRLPVTTSSGGNPAEPAKTLQQYRLLLISTDQKPGFSLFGWSWPFTQRDAL